MKNFFILIAMSLVGCSQYELKMDSDYANLAAAEKNSCYFNLDSKGQLVSWAPDAQVTFYFDGNIPDDHIEAIRKTAGVWKNTRGQDLIVIANDRRLSASTQNDGYNMIYWINDATKFNTLEQARTVVRWRNSKIVDADILINAASFQYYLSPPANGAKIHVPSLFIHEFGHALGLRHIPFFQSLMYASLGYLQVRIEPSAVDKQSIGCEYL